LTAIAGLTVVAQTGTGNIQVVVKDASTAIVAGAIVTITQMQTLQKYSTTTNKIYAGYIQDNWRVTPRLTLNLGWTAPIHFREIRHQNWRQSRELRVFPAG